MSREIKFKLIYQHETSKKIRSKVYTLDELIDESYEDTRYLEECDCEPIGETNVVECNCEDYLLGFKVIEKLQYTGLTDKYGKEIYEGDIIYAANCVAHSVVYGEFLNDECAGDVACSGIGFYLERKSMCYSLGSPYDGSVGYEIIGNIYENPELLEVSDEKEAEEEKKEVGEGKI